VGDRVLIFVGGWDIRGRLDVVANVLPATIREVGIMFDKRSVEFLESGRKPPVISVEKRNKLPSSPLYAGVPCGVRAGSVGMEHLQTIGVIIGKFGEYRIRTVGRTVIHNDQL
jgi:hypothetical protein